MEYKGKLYGRLGGETYFDTGKTSDDWDALEKKLHLKERAKTGVGLIAGERWRQIEKEGYTLEHDWHETMGQIAIAASCYAMPPNMDFRKYDIPPIWAWEKKYWKPTPENRIKELVKAGALIAAEIDRLTACGFKP